MRSPILSSLLCLVLVVCVLAWTKEDHEIFRLNDEVQSTEGNNATFYSFLSVSPRAKWDEIDKAFRKKSRTLHPDKVRQQYVAQYNMKKPGQKKGVHVSKGPNQKEIDRFMKGASERYARLGVVARLLKGEQRKRYDHFLNHGFPTWRGSGYYYTRYRPGLGTVLVGLFIAGGGVAHYYALKIGYNRQKEFMEKYIRSARKEAWGNEGGIPGLNTATIEVPAAPTVSAPESEDDPMAGLNRKQKREMGRQNKKDAKRPSTKAAKASAGRRLDTGENVEAALTTPQGAKRRVIAENGKPLLVDSVGNVFLIEEALNEETGETTTQEFLLDVDEIAVPTFYDTAVVKLPLWAWRKIYSPFVRSSAPVRDDTVSRTDSEIKAEGMLAADAEVPEEYERVRPTKKATTPQSSGSATPDLSGSSVLPSMSASMSASMADFEMIDGSTIPTGVDVNAQSAKKRSKKSKK